MVDKPKISVILPAYNAEKYVSKTLESLLTQTLKETEFICVNDGSKDGTLKVLKEFEQNDERIKIIDKKNEGVWKARIDGISAATGQYIAFIDADDYVENVFLEELYKSITKNNADIAVCGFRRIDEKTGKVLSQEMKYEENKIIEKNNFNMVNLTNISINFNNDIVNIYFDNSSNLEQEKENLIKEKERLENSILRREKLLSNENYVNKAPESIVNQERENLEKEKKELQLLLTRIV